MVRSSKAPCKAESPRLSQGFLLLSSNMSEPSTTPPPCPFEKRFPSQLVRDDVFFMSLAYNQAIDAWRQDEVPIGAVIEIGGEVVAAAHNTVETARDPT